MIQILNCLISFSLTILFIWLLKPAALHIGLVDEPGGRKSHTGRIPLIGGIAMFLGFTFALLLLNQSLAMYRPFIAASALMVIVGVLDDFHELTARTRLISQIIAALMVTVWGNNTLTQFGNILFFGDIHLGLLAMPITVFAIVGIINAVNMIDGVDGLAGSVSLMQITLLASLAYLAHDMVAFYILSLLIAALIGFLIFNMQTRFNNQASIFMGDAGSMFLGLALAWFLVSLSQGEHPAANPVTMLWIMVVPLFDTGRLLIQRLRHKRSPFSPDTNHIHHLLLNNGMRPMQVTISLSLITIIFGVISFLGGVYHIADGIMFFSFVLLFIIFYFSCHYLKAKELRQNAI